MKFIQGLAAFALLAAGSVAPALAQDAGTSTGYKAGDILVHLSALGVLPENFNSAVSLGKNWHVNVSNGVSPELDGSYFFTQHWSVELIAATTKHFVSVSDGSTTVKVGSTWVLPPTVTMQYHFPQFGMIRPYAGLGLTVAFMYSSSPAAGITKAGYSNGIGPTLDAGFDVPITGNWVANFDIKQMFIVTAARVDNGAVRALTELSPTVIGAGVGYQF